VPLELALWLFGFDRNFLKGGVSRLFFLGLLQFSVFFLENLLLVSMDIFKQAHYPTAR
jgi:hypothetical protein